MTSARCQRSRFWVSVRLDGALTELEAILLDRHLLRCGACRRFAEYTAADAELLHSQELAESRVSVEVPSRARGQARRRGVAISVAGLAAVAASVMLSIGTGAPTVGRPPSFAVATPVLQDDSLGVPRVPLQRKAKAADVLRGDPGQSF